VRIAARDERGPERIPAMSACAKSQKLTAE